MQDLDARTFDEAEFDQTAFELGIRQGRARPCSCQLLNRTGVAALGQAKRQMLPTIAVFGHHLYFQSHAERSSEAYVMPLYLRAIINRLTSTDDQTPEATAEAECRPSDGFGSLEPLTARFLK
jgi:hypothetical protein